MKILTKQEKRLKKQEYKKDHIDVFFDIKYDDYYANYDKTKDTRLFAPDFLKNKDFTQYTKRINEYIYHFYRLLAKRNFLHKRIWNLEQYDKRKLFENQKDFEFITKTLRFNNPEKRKEDMFAVLGYVSYYKMVEEANAFAKSVLEFSTMINKLEKMIDKFDPENKDKFVYDKTRIFNKKIEQFFTKIKLNFIPYISNLCNTIFR